MLFEVHRDHTYYYIKFIAVPLELSIYPIKLPKIYFQMDEKIWP